MSYLGALSPQGPPALPHHLPWAQSRMEELLPAQLFLFEATEDLNGMEGRCHAEEDLWVVVGEHLSVCLLDN